MKGKKRCFAIQKSPPHPLAAREMQLAQTHSPHHRKARSQNHAVAQFSRKDDSLQKLWNYASRSVIEKCSKIKWSQEEGATDSPTLTYQSHFEACSQIEKVREIVNQNLQNSLSPQYFRNLIKEDKRNILNTILWSEAGIELLINNLYQNSSQKRKDKAESEYRSWLDILTSILDAYERNKVDSKDVIDEGVIQGANSNNTMDSINPTDISKYITTEREIAIRRYSNAFTECSTHIP